LLKSCTIGREVHKLCKAVVSDKSPYHPALRLQLDIQ